MFTKDLVNRISKLNHQVHVLCWGPDPLGFEEQTEIFEPSTVTRLGGSQWSTRGRVFCDSPNMFDRWEEVDVVHIHGLWLPVYYRTVVSARRRRIPVVITTHGAYLPGSLRKKRLKKQIFWRLFQERALRMASAIHITSKVEQRMLKKHFPPEKIHLIRPGEKIASVRKSSFASDGVIHFCFLGRIHPLKRITLFLEAISGFDPARFKIVLIGPEEDGYGGEIRQKAESLKILDRVKFCGPRFGREKEDLLDQVDVGFLLSESENFGLVVLEFLKRGIPVIASRNSPWSELHEFRCGWWVWGNLRSVQNALDEIFSWEKTDFLQISERAVDLVEKRFAESQLVDGILGLYAEVIKQDN